MRISEAELTAIITSLAPNHVYPGVEVDDVIQEGWVYALELLEKKPEAEGTLIYTHVRNRMLNAIRDGYRNSEPPCKACHEGRHCKDGGCEAYRRWEVSQDRKSSLRKQSEEFEAYAPDETGLVITMDLQAKIDRELPAEDRADYRRLVEGAELTRYRRDQLKAIIRGILEGSYDES